MTFVRRTLQAALAPAIRDMVAKVYIPILFPLTFVLSLAALRLDEILGLAPLLPTPVNLLIAAGCFILGTFLWLWTYEQLTRMGEGSPSPTAGRTQKLVICGIYAHSRNPSIFGKTLGVLSVGLALNSAVFCLILVPLLLAGSLAEKVWRQEPPLAEIIGEAYEVYRREVPLFIPWKLLVMKKKSRRPTQT